MDTETILRAKQTRQIRELEAEVKALKAQIQEMRKELDVLKQQRKTSN